MKKLFVLTLVAASLIGCGEATHLYQRTLFGIDCRPDKLQANGQCAVSR